LKLIPSNPFADLVAAVRGNPKREHFIKPAVAEKVLAACPDASWRLLFALARWGGLRIPSEPLGMMWQDVDWAGGRMMIRSPKTEHHPGGESRIVPLFPELLPYLREAFEQAEPGAERVFPKWQYRGAGVNLRTGLLRIMAKAAVPPWPKLFQNLRATRETELAATWPMHVVCEWIGNSLAVANEHYLQVTESDYQKAAQNAAQYPAESALPERKAEPADVQKTPDLPNDSELYENVHMELVGAGGLEPPTSSL
jgi:integrase